MENRSSMYTHANTVKKTAKGAIVIGCITTEPSRNDCLIESANQSKIISTVTTISPVYKQLNCFIIFVIRIAGRRTPMTESLQN
jgi:hypothetical protein